MPWWFFCSEENCSDFHGGEGGGALTLFYCMGFGMWVLLLLLLLPLQLWQSSGLWRVKYKYDWSVAQVFLSSSASNEMKL